MFTVQSRRGSRHSKLCHSVTPTRDGLEVTPIVAMRHNALPGADWIRLRMALWLFCGFLRKDLGSLQGMRFKIPEKFMPVDDVVRRLFAFLQDLPRAPAGFGQSPAGNGG
jgi:hypothetical protein